MQPGPPAPPAAKPVDLRPLRSGRAPLIYGILAGSSVAAHSEASLMRAPAAVLGENCCRRLSLRVESPFPRHRVVSVSFVAGFVVGNNLTLLETNNGGDTWAPREVPELKEDNVNYRF